VDIVRKARKAYICVCCGDTIPKGEKYIHSKRKEPTYNEHDTQNGIRFVSERLCCDAMRCFNKIEGKP
jgi:hypothetical protein